MKGCRNIINCTITFGETLFRRGAASYFFLAFLVISLSDRVLLLPFAPVFMTGAFQVGLDSFFAEKDSKEGKSSKKSENKSKLKKRKKGIVDGDCLLPLLYPSIDGVETLGGEGDSVAGYIRVSTPRQAREGMSIEAQKDEHRKIAQKMGISRIYWVVDAGKSGRDFTHRKLNLILTLAEAKKISKLIISGIDRAGKKSLKLLGFLLQLRGYGVTIVTPQEELDIKKLADFMITTVKSFSAEEENEKRAHYSLRSKVYAFRERVWSLSVPLGYRRKGKWIEKEVIWIPVIKDIFDLFLKLKNYKAVADIVNKKHCNPPDKPLTRQQITRIVQNPVYMGKPTFSGKVAEKKFGKTVIDDPNLAYISNDAFEKANEIASVKHEKCKRRKKDLEELVENCGIEVLDFLPQVAPLCPNCGGLTRSNGLTYKCKDCGRQLRVPKKKEIEKIREWALKREKCLRTIIRILSRYTKKGQKIDDMELPLDMFQD